MYFEYQKNIILYVSFKSIIRFFRILYFKVECKFLGDNNKFRDILCWGITPDHNWSNWLIWPVDFFSSLKFGTSRFKLIYCHLWFLFIIFLGKGKVVPVLN
jgi:hypothetical protein